MSESGCGIARQSQLQLQLQLRFTAEEAPTSWPPCINPGGIGQHWHRHSTRPDLDHGTDERERERVRRPERGYRSRLDPVADPSTDVRCLFISTSLGLAVSAGGPPCDDVISSRPPVTTSPPLSVVDLVLGRRAGEGFTAPRLYGSTAATAPPSQWINLHLGLVANACVSSIGKAGAEQADGAGGDVLDRRPAFFFGLGTVSFSALNPFAPTVDTI
ncbi:MAG: hypothetical protein M1815_006221 [Lichina confinis]|nr:MAG: hypothetical protein M1815_006221 [Lichina confinis]